LHFSRKNSKIGEEKVAKEKEKTLSQELRVITLIE